MRTLLIFVLMSSSFSTFASVEKFGELFEKAREYEHEGKRDLAIKSFEEAYKLKTPELDKLPALIELVRLHRDDKKNGLYWISESEKWLNTHPEMKEKFSPWLSTMKGYVTKALKPEEAPANLKTWAIEEKLPELISEKKFSEAWSLVKDRDLSRADIRSQVVYDLLSAVAVKDKKRTHFCEGTFRRYPSSQAWTIKVCRYLQGWKENKTDPSLKKSAIEQIKDEEPESSHLSYALEAL